METPSEAVGKPSGVLDASAMLAFLWEEAGAEVVEALLVDPDVACFAHALNLCEVFYQFHRASGEDDAQLALQRLLDVGVERRVDLDEAVCAAAGRIKSEYRRVSIADCLGLVLAQSVGGEFVTGDRHELEPIAAAGVVAVNFIR